MDKGNCESDKHIQIWTDKEEWCKMPHQNDFYENVYFEYSIGRTQFCLQGSRQENGLVLFFFYNERKKTQPSPQTYVQYVWLYTSNLHFRKENRVTGEDPHTTSFRVTELITIWYKVAMQCFMGQF